jgi:hypothetical protein
MDVMDFEVLPGPSLAELASPRGTGADPAERTGSFVPFAEPPAGSALAPR